MHNGGCVNTEPDILEKVESDVGSLAGTLAAMDFIGERAQEKVRNLIYWDLPKLIKEHKKLRAISFRAADPVEYEYAVERTSLMRPDQTFIVGNYWGDLEERQDSLDGLEALNGTSVKYWMVKRRKAGKVERV